MAITLRIRAEDIHTELDAIEHRVESLTFVESRNDHLNTVNAPAEALNLTETGTDTLVPVP